MDQGRADQELITQEHVEAYHGNDDRYCFREELEECLAMIRENEHRIKKEAKKRRHGTGKPQIAVLGHDNSEGKVDRKYAPQAI